MKPQSFFKRTLFFFRPFWRHFALVIGILLIAQVLGAFAPYLFGKSVDAVSAHNKVDTFMYLGIAFAISLFQGQFLWWLKERINIKNLDYHIESAFSTSSLRKMLEFSVGQHINEHSGVKQGVVSKGQNALSSLMYNLAYSVIPTALQIVATLIILFIFDWRIAVSALLFLLIYLFVAYKRNQVYFPKMDEVYKKERSQYKLQSELYRNTTLVISEGRELDVSEEFKSSWKKLTNYSTNMWLGYVNVYYTHNILIIVGQYATLGLGVYLILIGHHSAGMFVALFSWTSSIFGNLVFIMNMQREMLFKVVEIKKYFDLLDIRPDINSGANGITIDSLNGQIEFKNVSFAYPYRKSAAEEESGEDSTDETKEEDHAVLGVSFKIPAGAKVGFVGISGSGKSTIVNLMRRFYDPTSGEILIDGTPLKDLNLRWFRSRIGNVEQKIDLFDRSIRENILFGLPGDQKNVAQEKLDHVVADASLTDFVAKLKEHGLDTMIGEGGIKVSGGERQRIGIARALIKDPKILIFDEATSALDSINEKLIHNAINRGAKGRTTIIIAHRLSTVMDADIIFVVANGKIVDSGTHEELQKSSAEYKKLIQNQILVG